jgi:hypothetical protein
MTATNTHGTQEGAPYEPATPPGLEPPSVYPSATGESRPGHSAPNYLGPGQPSTTSSPSPSDGADVDVPRVPLRVISSLSIRDGCDHPHTVNVDDMDPELVKDFVADRE